MATYLTLSRILLIAPFSAMFFIDAPWTLTAALVIFALAAATDFFDGKVARARGEVTSLGAALDPMADKLLIAAALLLLVRNGIVRDLAVLAALAILLREMLVAGLREAVGGTGGSLAVSWLAKWKTTAQLVAVGLLLAAAPTGLVGEALRPAAEALFWLAAGLTVWTGGEYAIRAVRLLRRPPG